MISEVMEEETAKQRKRKLDNIYAQRLRARRKEQRQGLNQKVRGLKEKNAQLKAEYNRLHALLESALSIISTEQQRYVDSRLLGPVNPSVVLDLSHQTSQTAIGSNVQHLTQLANTNVANNLQAQANSTLLRGFSLPQMPNLPLLASGSTLVRPEMELAVSLLQQLSAHQTSHTGSLNAYYGIPNFYPEHGFGAHRSRNLPVEDLIIPQRSRPDLISSLLLGSQSFTVPSSGIQEAITAEQRGPSYSHSLAQEGTRAILPSRQGIAATTLGDTLVSRLTSNRSSDLPRAPSQQEGDRGPNVSSQSRPDD